MTKREFDAAVRKCVRKKTGRFDPDLAAALPEDVRTGMVYTIVRHRAAVAEVLLTPAIDRSWLASMGYLHRITNPAGVPFVGTAEHALKWGQL